MHVSRLVDAGRGALDHDCRAETLHSYTQQVRNNRLGLWLFFISEVFLFGGLLVTRFYLWGNTRPELDQVIGLIVTSVLLISSFSMNMAETAIEHDDRKTFLRGLMTHRHARHDLPLRRDGLRVGPLPVAGRRPSLARPTASTAPWSLP